MALALRQQQILIGEQDTGKGDIFSKMTAKGRIETSVNTANEDCGCLHGDQ